MTSLLFGTPLFQAADNGHAEICRMLVDSGADLEAEMRRSEGAARDILLAEHARRETSALFEEARSTAPSQTRRRRI